MKFADFKNFRDYDRKIVKVTKLDKKYLKDYNLVEPITGILYIDKECGVTLKVLGDDRKTLKNIAYIIRIDKIKDAEFKIIKGKKEELEELEKIIANYYDEKFNMLLKDSLLDKFRDKVFINDVKCILATKKGLEQVWARLIAKTNQKDIYIGELLNEPYDKESGYHIKDKVMLVYYQNDGIKELVINNKVNIIE